MSDHRRLSRTELQRPAIVGGLVVALAAIGIGAWAAGDTAQSTPPAQPSTLVASSSAETSQFTCGGFSVGSSAPAPATISMVNTADAAVRATVAIASDSGARAATTIEVAPGSTASIQPGGMVTSGRFAAATVLIHGGGVAVTERIDGSNGVSDTPCSSTTSSSWYFAGNSSAKGQDPVVTLVNPSSTPAVAGMTFITGAAGAATPQGAQGLVIPPQSTISVPVASLVPHGGELATLVQATQGSVVAFMTQISPGPVGAAVTLGERSVQSSWLLPRAVASPGTAVSVQVANPTSTVQEVSVHVRLASGWVAPWTVTVDPFTVTSIPTAPSSRVPEGSVYAATVRATGPGVVAFLSTTATTASSSGWGITPLVDSTTAGWGRWVLPDPAGVVRSGVSLFNASSSPVTVTLRAVAGTSTTAAGQIGTVTVPPDAVTSFSSTQLKPSNGSTLEVEASSSLGVAQSFFGADPGVGMLNAMPLG
jgi:hypothetical protein